MNISPTNNQSQWCSVEMSPEWQPQKLEVQTRLKTSFQEIPASCSEENTQITPTFFHLWNLFVLGSKMPAHRAFMRKGLFVDFKVWEPLN